MPIFTPDDLLLWPVDYFKQPADGSLPAGKCRRISQKWLDCPTGLLPFFPRMKLFRGLVRGFAQELATVRTTGHGKVNNH